MPDLHFKCCGCRQGLVVDEEGVGLEFQCPHCARSQRIPAPATVQAAPEPALFERRASGSEGLWSAQERIWQNEHQSAEQAVTLVERDQRISALSAERDWLAAQLDEERMRRQAIEPELDLARNEWSAAEKRATEFEAGFNQASLHLQQARLVIGQMEKQLDLLKSERTAAVMEMGAKQEQVAELSLQLGRAEAGRAEWEQIAGRARTELERRAHHLSELQTAFDQLAGQGDTLRSGLSRLRAELGMVTSQRDKLQAAVDEDSALADYVQVKEDREHLEVELRETQGRLGDLREKNEELGKEREALRKERTELQLKIAALRDANHNTQLEQDNEVLRRMVERLNEEMKEFRPALAKKKRRADAGGLLGEIAKGAIARCFVDPDEA